MNRRKQPDRKARPKKRPRSAANSEQVKRPRIQVEQVPAWSPQLKQLSLTRTVSSSVSSSETGQPRMKNFPRIPWPKKKRSYSRPKKPVAYWSDGSAGLHTLSDCVLSMEGSDKEATVEPQKKNNKPRKNNNTHHRWVGEEVKLLLQLFDSDEAVRKYHSGNIAFCRFVADQINLQLGHYDGYVDLDADSIKDKMKVIHRIHSYGNPKGKVSQFMMEIVELYRDRIDLVCNTNSSSALSRSDAPSSSASVQGQGLREVSHVGAIRYLRRQGIFDNQELRRYSIVLEDVHNRVLFASCDTFDERKQLLDELVSANQPRL